MWRDHLHGGWTLIGLSVYLLCFNVAHLHGMWRSIGLFISAYISLLLCWIKERGYMETTTCSLTFERLVCLCCERKRREKRVDWLLILKLLDFLLKNTCECLLIKQMNK